LHNALNINDNPTWHQEIEHKFLVNIKAKYILSKTIDKSNAFTYTIEPALGTKDIFIANTLGYTFFLGLLI